MTTRECIIKGSFWFGELEKAGEGAIATALVSEIFDDVESRVCGNCEFNTKFIECDANVSRPSDFISLQHGYEPQLTFGCNRWKKK